MLKNGTALRFCTAILSKLPPCIPSFLRRFTSLFGGVGLRYLAQYCHRLIRRKLGG
jgi:hypothetical protein